ncbi:MAG TPA: TadE/TadG family type IV pilus assembly protein [Rhizomicrobium sp.]|jgi:Flp pilus assembly protein TadG|nr:TadE/TadG family type IV pilus assembly protein [Rhizomicrobium sp.]
MNSYRLVSGESGAKDRAGEHCRSAAFSDNRGNAAIEFALLFPLLLLLTFGIVCYGGYFWMAHNIQELANDAARAAIAGLTDEERQNLAQTTVADEIAKYEVLEPSLATVTYSGDSQYFTVDVSYDASTTPFWVARDLLPMPPTTIQRSASIRLGGF